MADNINITEGSGAVVKTDQLATGEHVQYVKLMDGTADSSTVAAVGANGLEVDVKASVLPTGAATASNQTTANNSLSSIDGKITACDTGNVTISSALPAGTNTIGSVKLTDGTETASINASNQLEVAVGNTVTVSATDLDIRDLTSSDVVTVTGGAGQAADVKVTLDGEAVVLGAGTNAIGKLAANSGVDIGDVTINNTAASPVYTESVIENATLVKKTVDFSASQTAQAIWTPASGKKFVICDIVVSASAAGVITIFDNTDDTTNRICKLNLAANGGAVINYRKPIVSAAVDNVLKYTTGTGIAGSITVSGYEI